MTFIKLDKNLCAQIDNKTFTASFSPLGLIISCEGQTVYESDKGWTDVFRGLRDQVGEFLLSPFLIELRERVKSMMETVMEGDGKKYFNQFLIETNNVLNPARYLIHRAILDDRYCELLEDDGNLSKGTRLLISSRQSHTSREPDFPHEVVGITAKGQRFFVPIAKLVKWEIELGNAA